MFTNILFRLELDLSRFESLGSRLQALAALKSGSQTSKPQMQGENLKKFCDGQVGKALGTMSLATAEDGLALANSTVGNPDIDIAK